MKKKPIASVKEKACACPCVLALLIEVLGSNPAEGGIQLLTTRRFILQNLLLSPFHRLDMTDILSKETKIISHDGDDDDLMLFVSFDSI